MSIVNQLIQQYENKVRGVDDKQIINKLSTKIVRDLQELNWSANEEWLQASLPLLQFLSDKGLNLNQKFLNTTLGEKLLADAVWGMADKNFIRFLLQQGVIPDKVDVEIALGLGKTDDLTEKKREKRIDIAELLLQYGADATQLFDEAIINNNMELMQFLLHNYAKMNNETLDFLHYIDKKKGRAEMVNMVAAKNKKNLQTLGNCATQSQHHIAQRWCNPDFAAQTAFTQTNKNILPIWKNPFTEKEEKINIMKVQFAYYQLCEGYGEPVGKKGQILTENEIKVALAELMNIAFGRNIRPHNTTKNEICALLQEELKKYL